MPSAMMICSDVYLRYDNGPVQHFRCHDRNLFIRTQVERGIDHTDAGKPAPYVVSVATEADYEAQRRRRK